MSAKTSAVADEPIQVLFALHTGFNLMDFAGPVEVFSSALHDLQDPTSKAFDITIAGDDTSVVSDQGVIVSTQISWKEAHERLEEWDVVVVLGGNTSRILKSNENEPLPLIKAYAELQEKDPSRERTLLSICTGALFLARQDILLGLAATTHPDFMTTFENECSQAVVRTGDKRTDVHEDARYVVNNLRFDVGDDDPYVKTKEELSDRRPSNARKGSISFKQSRRRESIARREEMRLGGLRVITSGGVAAGIDAALYVVSALVSIESANEVARFMQVTWTKGVVVDGVDV